MILGVDVWSGYGRIAWERAAAAGVRFAIVKATQGNDGCDPRAKENIIGAKNAGVLVGAYLFAYPLPPGRPGRSPEEQARKFFADVDGLGRERGELPPAIDLEWPPQYERDERTSQIIDRWKQWGCTAESIVEWTVRCVDEIERLWGRLPLLYTYPHFAQSLGPALKGSGLERCPLWIANYTSPKNWTPAAGVEPIVPAPWSGWAVWQFSADGSPIAIPGIPACPLDRNVIRDEATLRRLAMLDESSPTVVVDVPEMRPEPFTSRIVHPLVPLGRPALDGELPDTPDSDDAD